MRGLSRTTLSRRARRRAAELLGRPLTTKEHVHHKNGDSSDNRSENLQVMTHGEHSRLHHRQGDMHVHRFTTEERHRGGRLGGRLGGPVRRYSDTQLLQGIRCVARRSTRSSLTYKEYNRLRGSDHAGAYCCERRLGSWRHAKQLAGVT